MNNKHNDTDKIPIAISQCLLGEEVRYDAGHKRDAYIIGTLGQFFAFVPVCPEVAIGLGVPREPIRLVGDPSEPRAVGIRSPDIDVTEALRDYGKKQAVKLTNICGYIFKKGSPSCGMERVKIHTEQGMPNHTGRGIYTRVFMRNNPLIPCEEEGRLGDPSLRENFIQRVFVLHRWKQLASGTLTPASLVAFHSQHKFIIMAHSREAYQQLGRWVAEAGKGDFQELKERYIAGLMSALTRRTTRNRHVNVLEHLMGFLKKQLDKEDKNELSETIHAYRRGDLPLIVPITLLNHHFRRHPNPYVKDQYYLNPHPPELRLRNLI